MRQMGTPVSDDYIYETTGIPKPDNYDELKRETTDSQETMKNELPPGGKQLEKKEKKREKKQEDGIVDRIKAFFAHAPKSGALKW